MPHISSPPLPGIVGLFAFRPESAHPLSLLAEQILRGPSPLSSQERELIAATVSEENSCRFCHMSHAAAANAHAGDDDFVKKSLRDPTSLSPKMQALSKIAKKVARSGRDVSADHIKAARDAGATDVEIHDAVLIAAAFCMYNRYVDGLAAITPDEPAAYKDMGVMLAKQGYVAALEMAK